MNERKWTFFSLVSLGLALAGGILPAQAGGREKGRSLFAFQGRGGSSRQGRGEEKPEDYLKAAKLDRESGNLDSALYWCRKISREFPKNRKVTPQALVLGAEILLEMNRPMKARFWTTDAIRRFRDLPDYQKRMAILHRWAMTRLTYVFRNRPRTHIAQYCLILQWSVRGLSGEEIRIRYDRFWEELKRHLRDWERPGKEKGRERYPPSGMGRVMEWLTAALTKDVLAVHGIRCKALDDLVPLLKKKIRMLRELWAAPTPDPRALENFDKLMRLYWKKFDEFSAETKKLVTFHIPSRRKVTKARKEKPLSSMSRKELMEKVRELTRKVEGLEKKIREMKERRERGEREGRKKKKKK